jgi:hypothetical protein
MLDNPDLKSEEREVVVKALSEPWRYPSTRIAATLSQRLGYRVSDSTVTKHRSQPQQCSCAD